MKITINRNEFYFRSDLNRTNKKDLLDLIAEKLNIPDNNWAIISDVYPNFPATALWVIADCDINEFMRMKAISQLFVPFGVTLEFEE